MVELIVDCRNLLILVGVCCPEEVDGTDSFISSTSKESKESTDSTDAVEVEATGDSGSSSSIVPVTDDSLIG